MTLGTSMERPDLTIEAARYKLGLLLSDDLVRTADALLTCGVYSPVIDELASMVDPVSTEAGALFERVLTESGVPVPSVDEAVSKLLSAYISRIALGTVQSRAGLDSIVRVYWAAEVTGDAGGRAGASLGIQDLITCYYSYDEPMAWPRRLGPEMPSEAEKAAALDADAVQFAREWLAAQSA